MLKSVLEIVYAFLALRRPPLFTGGRPHQLRLLLFLAVHCVCRLCHHVGEPVSASALREQKRPL